MPPAVLERDLGDLDVQLVLMLQGSILCLGRSPDQSRLVSLARRCDELIGGRGFSTGTRSR
jgi:hypothetical protein